MFSKNKICEKSLEYLTTCSSESQLFTSFICTDKDSAEKLKSQLIKRKFKNIEAFSTSMGYSVKIYPPTRNSINTEEYVKRIKLENKEYNKFYRIQSILLMGTANSKETQNFLNFSLRERKA